MKIRLQFHDNCITVYNINSKERIMIMRVSYTKEEILQIVKDNDIRFFRCQFTDIFGTLKNIAITRRQLESAMHDGVRIDGSSINGFVRIQESDMILRLDLDTFAIMPWLDNGYKTARFICDVYTVDGKPFEGDPRYVLRKVADKAKALGYTMNVGPEMEFFLFKINEDQSISTVTNDNGGYFDLSPIDKGEDARRDIAVALEEMGFEIEATHHEVAIGQHEIDFKYADVLTAADRIMTFKMVARAIAEKHGLYPTFMPKPIFGINGSGMHCNQSLTKDGVNVFYDGADENKLSKIAYGYIAGLLKHVKNFAAITNPLVNSYKRLVVGYEAPVYLAWSKSNRSPLIRIPNAPKEGTRVELRNPDPSCNPYLALALMLAAGLEGIEKNLTPPPAVNANIYEMSQEELSDNGLDSLPKDLYEAIKLMASDKLVNDTLGKHITDYYVKAKLIEWERYCITVHPWETDEYLTVF